MKAETQINSETTNHTFRPIQQKDNPQVANVIRRVMTEFHCVGEGYSIQDPEVDDMFNTYDNELSAFFVIEDRQGKILGCGGIGPLANGDADVCELKKMYFYSELRGLGWGKKLLTHCLEVARRKGYKHCYLETVERMEAANQLYAKMGFQKMSTPCGNTGHSSCDSYYMLEL
ncbi:MAG: GNAT family N-acetyltransferase [Saprospiraceae bacterium]|nr:GNAT family N-acetyltransferase [Saprospiraceae bacterium]MCB9344650.1 GNAT family N-acetyltransferase [Lewinellaceae bacterium]